MQIAIVFGFFLLAVIIGAAIENRNQEEPKKIDETDSNINLKINNIKTKLENLIEIRDLTIKIEGSKKSELIIKQNQIIRYIYSYYEKYKLLLFSNLINKESERLIEKYKKDRDYGQLFEGINGKIDEFYLSITNDNLLVKNDVFIKVRDDYKERTKRILRNVLIEQTNSVVKEISPLNDNAFIKSIMIDYTLPELTKEDLDLSFDKFIAEQSLL